MLPIQSHFSFDLSLQNHDLYCISVMNMDMMDRVMRPSCTFVSVEAPVVRWWLVLGRAARCCSSVMNTLSHWRMET